jgi:hypothetical protein
MDVLEIRIFNQLVPTHLLCIRINILLKTDLKRPKRGIVGTKALLDQLRTMFSILCRHLRIR